MCSENKLPESISFHVDGPPDSFAFRKISVPIGYDTMDFSIHIPQTVDHQICQVLRSTRDLKLKEHKTEFVRSKKLRTKAGKPKKVLSAIEWGMVAGDLSCTTLMDFLYRKRIKANYKDVDVFNYDGLRGSEVLSHLITIVDCLNLVNETYIAKVTGNGYNEIANSYMQKLPEHKRLQNRIRRTNALLRQL